MTNISDPTRIQIQPQPQTQNQTEPHPDPVEIKLHNAALSLARCLSPKDAGPMLDAMKEDLRGSVANYALGDSSGLDAYLLMQAHILDGLFNRATQRGLRPDGGIDEERIDLALRSQRHFRLTLETLKKIELSRALHSERKKSANELLSVSKNAPLDRGR